MPSDRRRSRVLAMQALCQWDVQRDDSAHALADFLAEQDASRGVVRYATKLVETFWARGETIDRQIESAVVDWDLSRISPVERNVMRIAIVEFAAGDVPAKVAINEALEIGREYGGAESPRFINGVLDRVLKDSREAGKDGV